MKPPLIENELVDLIIKWVSKRAHANGAARARITADTDLMQSELIDSLGFVELMMFIESQTGRNIDLADVDPEEFSVVRGLSRIALRNGRRVEVTRQ